MSRTPRYPPDVFTPAPALFHATTRDGDTIPPLRYKPCPPECATSTCETFVAKPHPKKPSAGMSWSAIAAGLDPFRPPPPSTTACSTTPVIKNKIRTRQSNRPREDESIKVNKTHRKTNHLRTRQTSTDRPTRPSIGYPSVGTRHVAGSPRGTSRGRARTRRLGCPRRGCSSRRLSKPVTQNTSSH